MKARGIHDAFHASLLRPHFPNDDRRFPGCQLHQIPGFGESPTEWTVDRILSHIGKGVEAEFEVQWSTGDVTWTPYHEIKHLQVFDEYCEALGITTINQLGTKTNGKHLPGGTMRIASLRIGGNEGTYASQLHEWLKRKDIKENKKRERETTKNAPSTYPGDPLPGYLEVFKAKHPYAPDPADHPEKVADAKKTFVPNAISGVNMTEEAFHNLLLYNERMQVQVLELAKAAAKGTSKYRDQGGHKPFPGPFPGPIPRAPISPPSIPLDPFPWPIPRPWSHQRAPEVDHRGYRGKSLSGRMGGSSPRIHYQPNGLPVPLGKGKPRYRGKKPTRGKYRGGRSFQPKTDKDVLMADDMAGSSKDPVEQQTTEDQYEESWEDTYEAPDPTEFGMDA
ncbi:hypothetical protein NLI96_g1809 [Meripilus lineatus]|uniref:Uncharacterized protein n=1 Tax=Meripilus lineatus TaxID=2056292 RepID=A0AAD5VC56_9APHY|nr:hypothetical protein NLI96_g1809 [Physisporinus lineatus]